MIHPRERTLEERLVHVPAETVTLEGNLSLPEGAEAVVLFAHGSGSGRHSPATAMSHTYSMRQNWQHC